MNNQYFTGGLLNLNINGFNVKDNTRCDFPLPLTLPNCDGSGGANKSTNNNGTVKNSISLVIAPNPTKESTTINFKSISTAPTIEIYSILGKLINNYSAKTVIGKWDLDTTNLPSGIYIVVLKENNGIITQQKLIIE